MSTENAKVLDEEERDQERDHGEARRSDRDGAEPDEPLPDAESSPEPRSESKPRRIFLPPETGGGINLQFVPSDKKKAPPPKKPTPVEAAQAQATETWERQAANLGDSVSWTLERTSPQAWRGREVPCGIFPQEFTGPATVTEIARAGGGGIYFVNYTDSATGKARKIGPIKIAGDPKFNVGISDEGERDRDEDGEGLFFPGMPADFRAGSTQRPEDDVWITTYDNRSGAWVKRRKSDVEREAAMMRQEPQNDALRREFMAQLAATQEAFRRQGEETNKLVQQMMLAVERASAPKEDVAGKFLEIERLRLQAEKAEKADELKFMREKLEADRKALEARMIHERELADTKLEAERARAEADKKAVEARAEADRERLAAEKEAAETRLSEINKQASERLDKAHEAMLAAVREKGDPMGQVSGIFSLFREFSDITGDGEKPNEEDKPKTKLDRFFGLFEKAAEKAIPALEPMLRRTVEGYMAEANAAAPKPQQIPHRPQPVSNQRPQQSQQRPPKTATSPPAPEQAEGESSVDEQQADGAAVLKLVEELGDMMNRNVAPSVAAKDVAEENPRGAKMLRAYKSVDHLVDELSTVAPLFGPHEAAIMALIERAKGPGKSWCTDFLTSIRKVQ